MSATRWLCVLLLAGWSACDAVDDQSLGALSNSDAPEDLDAGSARDAGSRGNRDATIARPCCDAWAEFWEASPDRCDETLCRQMPPPPPSSRSVH